MYRQDKSQYYRPSPFFPEHRSARLPVAGTVAHDPDPVLQDPPQSLTAADLSRGRDRYDVYCTPCHGWAGDGDGLVVQRAYLRPPSLHEASLRKQSIEHTVEVISSGWGAMPAYAAQIPGRDRWLIAHYVRVLQLSRRVPLASLPPEEQKTLEGISE